MWKSTDIEEKMGSNETVGELLIAYFRGWAKV
jgi:hypothetical protein